MLDYTALASALREAVRHADCLVIHATEIHRLYQECGNTETVDKARAFRATCRAAALEARARARRESVAV